MVRQSRGVCTAAGCSSPVKAVTWCGKHYERWRKYRSVEDAVMHHQWGATTSKPCSVRDCERKLVARSFCATHYYRYRKYGTTDESALHHQWGIGRFDKFGYWQIAVGKKADGSKHYRPEHQLVMEDLLGRRLHPWENVHHRNGIRNDNRPENLELWAKPQAPGQRVEDLVLWVITCYRDEVEKALAASGGTNSVPDPDPDPD